MEKFQDEGYLYFKGEQLNRTKNDVLLVDDIQELAGKEKTQDELILLFNAFYESGKRIMMTSSLKEGHHGLKERLISRAFWGDHAEISNSYVQVKY